MWRACHAHNRNRDLIPLTRELVARLPGPPVTATPDSAGSRSTALTVRRENGPRRRALRGRRRAHKRYGGSYYLATT
jgi:hypothetical protein